MLIKWYFHREQKIEVVLAIQLLVTTVLICRHPHLLKRTITTAQVTIAKNCHLSAVIYHTFIKKMLQKKWEYSRWLICRVTSKKYAIVHWDLFNVEFFRRNDGYFTCLDWLVTSSFKVWKIIQTIKIDIINIYLDFKMALVLIFMYILWIIFFILFVFY